MSSTKRKLPLYQDVDGFRLAAAFSADNFRSALRYSPRPDDLFIATYPKCGTTWVQNIVACIYRKGRPFESGVEFMSQTPFLEFLGAEAAEQMRRPGAIKVHLPFRLTPWSPDARYIFIARNPKDTCVSFYHHTENLPLYEFGGGLFDDYFELFVEGEVDFGDYFDTLLSWYNERHRPNVLFLTYEQLQKDTRGCVLNIAEFMGPQYKQMLEEDGSILDAVIRHSSIGFMREHLNRHFSEMAQLPREVVENSEDIPAGLRRALLEGMSGQRSMYQSDVTKNNFIRKGIVGDWRNYFSALQNARMMKKFEERTRGTDIPDLWKDCM